MQIEDSDAEGEDDSGLDREAIANQLFDDEVRVILIYFCRSIIADLFSLSCIILVSIHTFSHPWR